MKFIILVITLFTLVPANTITLHGDTLELDSVAMKGEKEFELYFSKNDSLAACFKVWYDSYQNEFLVDYYKLKMRRVPEHDTLDWEMK